MKYLVHPSWTPLATAFRVRRQVVAMPMEGMTSCCEVRRECASSMSAAGRVGGHTVHRTDPINHDKRAADGRRRPRHDIAVKGMPGILRLFVRVRVFCLDALGNTRQVVELEPGA